MHDHYRRRDLQAADTTNWKQRAQRIAGPLQPYTSPTLSASEIGQYAFCPQAWFLARCDVPVDAEARSRLAAGTRAHRRIGQRTDLVQAAELARRWLLVVMAGLLAMTALLASRGGI